MTYRGFDVLEVEPNWRDGLESTYRRSWLRFDPGTGKVRVDDRTGITALDNSFAWFMADRAAVAEFRAFVAARKGAAVPFWFPSWRSDLQLRTDAASTDTTLTIDAIGYTKYLFPQRSRRFVAFILSDSKIYREIVNANDPGDGVSETITIDSAPGVALPAASTLICFLFLCRLESDEVKITWHTSSVAEASLAFREIPREVP